ncbi:MAG TPA: histidine kinase [Candidatus Angelobacter sp.]|nr:histidine kinase [Candidatus Angelobacter sp.]
MKKHGTEKLLKIPVRGLVLSFLIATVLAVTLCVAWYAEVMSSGVQASFTSGLLWYFLEVYLWLLLCPLIRSFNRRLPLAPPKARIYLTHALMAIVLPSLMRLLGLFIDRHLDPGFTGNMPFTFRYLAIYCAFRVPGQIVTYSLILALFAARDYHKGLRKEAERRALLETQLARAELMALRMQLHPHFLFNTLHSVSALIEPHPTEAIRMISRLGEFLRLSIDQKDSRMISLEEEIRFVELYFGIEQVRFADRMHLLVNIAPGTEAAVVPNLILQPLIENALRHGAWKHEGAVRVEVVSRAVDHSVEILVRNAQKSAPEGMERPIREGIGLSNVRSRLQLLYPERFKFEYGWISPGVFQALIALPAFQGEPTL